MNHATGRSANPDDASPVSGNVTQDAVVIVPGIMGSALRDTATGRLLWGLSGTRWLVRAWTGRDGLAALRMTDDELAGRFGRVTATGLLRHSAWTPHLRGFEPYTALGAAMRRCVPDPAAVLEFAYDWRLPVAVNGRLLAAAARKHLMDWRAHPAHDAARRLRRDETPARLVFVSHSMGGLVTQAALDPVHDSDLAGDTRAVLTLGTPFHGAVKAVSILNSGRGTPVPLPHGRLRRLCATMPGLHDLLPRYTCVLEGASARRLTPGDVAGIGGDPDLARLAADDAVRREAVALPGHHAVVGVRQETTQSLSIDGGVVHAHCHTVRRHSDDSFIRHPDGRLATFDCEGDGTVSTESAALGAFTTPLPLQHGAVAADPFAMDALAELVRGDRHLGPPMGGAGCGLDTPDLAEAGSPWTMTIRGPASPSGVTCRVERLDGTELPPARLSLHNRRLTATVRADEPGLYRVTVRSRDNSRVSQLVLVAPPGGAEADGNEDTSPDQPW
ncbi:hypothetical protein ACIPRD_10150 [Streptomyces sp. NPDC090108]|uniref:lipase/acyltransferase domain-containing protein n=1 Tax=Streptomyces sp. NPDC090108 TaxID=3365947 RepID=UPI00382DBCC9